MSEMFVPSELYVLAQAWIWVCAVRVGLWLMPFLRLKRVVCFLTRKRPTQTRPHLVIRIAWAVSAASAYVPRATCLTRALALHILLRRLGLQSRIHIGVTKEKGLIDSHAWVESQDKIVIGDQELARYIPIMVWD
jgi:hypothetical protein